MARNFGKIKISDYARLSINPLRKITQEQKIDPNPAKRSITLQLGDPTIFGNFPPPVALISALSNAVVHDKFPYNISYGKFEARQAVAEYSKHQGEISPDDVILSSGCSHALEMTVLTLVQPGENVLIPRPSYNYKTWIDGMKIETKAYNLDPEKSWDIDLVQMESLIDDKTRAIIINNPGNPCGNCFSKEHILEIIALAERHQLPIVADEIYEHFVFPGIEYHSISSLSKNVPVLTCSGLSKRFLVPGIRMGWIIVHDRNGVLDEVKQGLRNVSARILGPNSTVQYALPDILQNTPQRFFVNKMMKISYNADLAYELLSKIPGLKPIKPRGSMYMMIQIELDKFPEFQSCLEFTQQLIREQSVLVFPGHPCFNYPGFMRIVLTVTDGMIKESCKRLKEFCETHAKL
ncbi:hypothetical protein ACKWTF_005384 [Chironomus riparius]